MNPFQPTIATSSSTTTSPKKPGNKRKGAAFARYNAIHEASLLIARLQNVARTIPDLIAPLDFSSPTTLRMQFNNNARMQFKTFTVCPRCYSILKPRSSAPITGKTHAFFNCNICNTPSTVSIVDGKFLDSNRKIHYKLDLQDTITYMRDNYPELFV